MSSNTYFSQAEVAKLVKRSFEYLLPFIKDFVESSLPVKLTLVQDSVAIEGTEEDQKTVSIFLEDILSILIDQIKSEILDSVILGN